MRSILPRLACALFLFAFSAAAQVQVASPKQISVGRGNTVPSGTSGSPSLPSNNNLMVFNSNASNLVENDTNSKADIFLSDLATGQLTRLSTRAGVEGDGDSTQPFISPLLPDNFFAVAFSSKAKNLSSTSDTLNNKDVFIHIPSLSLTDVISLAPGKVFPNNDSTVTSITALSAPNTLLVVMESDATNLVSADTNGKTDIFLATVAVPASAAAFDPGTVSIQRISRAASGAQESDGDSTSGVISADGKFVFFVSKATNLVNGVTTNGSQVFRYEVATGVTSLVSKTSAGVAGNGDSSQPTTSFTGRFVSYLTQSSNIVPSASSSKTAVVVVDTLTGGFFQANTSVTGEAGNGSARDATISPNARFLSFSDSSSNLVSADSNGQADVFIKDFSTGAITRVSNAVGGAEANGRSDVVSFTSSGYNGENIALSYRSFATNLTSEGLSGGADVFNSAASVSNLVLSKATTLEVPPDVSVSGRQGTFKLQKFASVQAKSATLTRASKPKLSIRYDIKVDADSRKKRDNRRKTSKKNQISLKGLKPGGYSSSYRVLTLRGEKTVRKTKFSPPQRFTVS